MAVPVTTKIEKLNIRLGEKPKAKIPEVSYELQGIYNALHILDKYLDEVRLYYEGNDSQDPAESMRFRTSFWAEAGQGIAAGSIVSSYNNTIINGAGCSPTVGNITGAGWANNELTQYRSNLQFDVQSYFIALTSAKAGELVQCGMEPGVIKITGAKCGEVVWAANALSTRATRDANTSDQIVRGHDQTKDGKVYLGLGSYTHYKANPNPSDPQVELRTESYQMPGYPFLSGGTYNYNYVFLVPVGIAIADDYVLFADYVSQLQYN